MPISGHLRKEKTLEFTNPGMVGQFKKRHGLSEKTIRESGSVCEFDCDQWKNNVLKKVLQDFTLLITFLISTKLGFSLNACQTRLLLLKMTIVMEVKTAKGGLTV